MTEFDSPDERDEVLDAIGDRETNIYLEKKAESDKSNIVEILRHAPFITQQERNEAADRILKLEGLLNQIYDGFWGDTASGYHIWSIKDDDLPEWERTE